MFFFAPIPTAAHLVFIIIIQIDQQDHVQYAPIFGHISESRVRFSNRWTFFSEMLQHTVKSVLRKSNTPQKPDVQEKKKKSQIIKNNVSKGNTKP